MSMVWVSLWNRKTGCVATRPIYRHIQRIIDIEKHYTDKRMNHLHIMQTMTSRSNIQTKEPSRHLQIQTVSSRSIIQTKNHLGIYTYKQCHLEALYRQRKNHLGIYTYKQSHLEALSRQRKNHLGIYTYKQCHREALYRERTIYIYRQCHRETLDRHQKGPFSYTWNEIQKNYTDSIKRKETSQYPYPATVPRFWWYHNHLLLLVFKIV